MMLLSSCPSEVIIIGEWIGKGGDPQQTHSHLDYFFDDVPTLTTISHC